MIRFRVALAFFAAILLALIFPAPTQASATMQASGSSSSSSSSSSSTQNNTVSQSNSSSNSNTTVQTTVQTIVQTRTVTRRPAPPAKPTPAPPRSTTVYRVDASRAGNLPIGTSNAAWSKDTNVTLVTQACSGFRCITVQQVSQTGCGSSSRYVGCAFRYSDGSCTAQVLGSLSAALKRAVLEHETGHCLGLDHNTSDRTSIMVPVFDSNRLPPGPDAIDRANVRALHR